MTTAHILGYPRIGEFRELKTEVEKYWKASVSQEDLLKVQHAQEQKIWEDQKNLGLDLITVGDYALYDHILDTSVTFSVIPERFANAGDEIDTMFCMARGRTPKGVEAFACEMTKWFDTNYHYIVPEFAKGQTFKLNSTRLVNAISRAKSFNHSKIKPVIVGPLTYLWLGKSEDGFNKLDLLENLLVEYVKLLQVLKENGIEWVQVDEPILSLDLDQAWKSAFVTAYSKLVVPELKLLLTTYFGELRDNLEFVAQLPVAGLHIDLCKGEDQLDEVLKKWPTDKVLSLGVVDGRNIWKSYLKKKLEILQTARKSRSDETIWVASSCSLLHSPIDLAHETKLDAEIKSWLAFAKQKIEEVSLLSRGFKNGADSIKGKLDENERDVLSRTTSKKIHDDAVKERVKNVTPEISKRKNTYEVRYKVQDKKYNLPLLPTTTIGSFPQTADIRRARLQFKKGELSEADYTKLMKEEIEKVIRFQEKIGLDILVHGEPERNDMVEYFGELLDGFAFTQNGWVQSYGSRCVKPPIIYGDVKRAAPMTVKWSTYSQSLTNKPVKGMLTGPITILDWSFVRDDQPRKTTTIQIALALRDEVVDLEKAGITVIQIDEPAFREALPLRRNNWEEYLQWAAESFRISASGVEDSTQIHTHMCYAEFNDIIRYIAELDADVISIESSRSKMELLNAFEQYKYPNSIGPGVYDIHSPIVPSKEDIVTLIQQALSHIPVNQLHINPDCGLKTRDWPEVEKSLKFMVDAVQQVRSTL